MKHKCLALAASLLLLGGSFANSNNNLPTQEKTTDVIYFDSDKGWALLLDSKFRCDYWSLSRYYETQMTYAHCGVASSVITLNALEIPKPKQAKYKNFGFFTQEDFFTDAVKKIVAPEDVARRGMELEEITDALNTFPVTAEMTKASDIDLEDFRNLVKKTLKTKDQILIVDFFRPSLGQVGGGHYSPVAAYNEQQDLVLVMEVSRYKHPPFWVKTEKLLNAMKDVEPSTETRGFVLVSKK